MSVNILNSKKRKLSDSLNSIKSNSLKLFKNINTVESLSDCGIFSKIMCFYCFDVLNNYLTKTELTIPSDFGNKS